MKERLRRVDRVFARYPIYFLTTCTAGRNALLASDAVHGSWMEFAERGSEYGAWPGAYVIMPDHLHVFVRMDPERTSLPAWMKSLKNTLSRTLRATGVAAPHWQKGYFDHVMRSVASYSQKWDYVRENPVRAGLVARAEDWPFTGQIHPLDFLNM